MKYDLKKMQKNEPELYNSIEENARFLGYIRATQSLSDVTPEPGSMLDGMIKLEVSNYDYASNVIPTGDVNADAVIAEMHRIHQNRLGRRGITI